jgi:hypothetical protein
LTSPVRQQSFPLEPEQFIMRDRPWRVLAATAELLYAVDTPEATPLTAGKSLATHQPSEFLHRVEVLDRLSVDQLVQHVFDSDQSFLKVAHTEVAGCVDRGDDFNGFGHRCVLVIEGQNSPTLQYTWNRPIPRTPAPKNQAAAAPARTQGDGEELAAPLLRFKNEGVDLILSKKPFARTGPDVFDLASSHPHLEGVNTHAKLAGRISG